MLKRKELSNCTLSTLIYCLAHLQIYSPFRDKLYKSLRDKCAEIYKSYLTQECQSDDTEINNDFLCEENLWLIKGDDNAQKLDNFIGLGLMHSINLFELMDKKISIC